MTKNIKLTRAPGYFSISSQALRLAIAILLISVLAACAAAPAKSSSSMSGAQGKSAAGMDGAVEMFNSGDYQGALSSFDTIIAGERSSANDRRLAHLGKAMMYLDPEQDLYSVENAKKSQAAARQVTPAEDEGFSFETNLLMEAVSAVIGSQSKNASLQAAFGNSEEELEQINRDRARLTAERDELLVEQRRLNEALEKLKQLTLGN